MLRDAARSLLAAWRNGRPGELEKELERAARACRLPAGCPADEGERGELLAGIVEQMGACLISGEFSGAAVYERLLAHLAGPGVPRAPRATCNGYAHLC